MRSYLQRIASRTVSRNSGPIRPYVRTESPIARADNRLAMPGFESAGFAIFETTVDPQVHSAPYTVSSDLSPRLDISDARKPPGPEVASSAGRARPVFGSDDESSVRGPDELVPPDSHPNSVAHAATRSESAFLKSEATDSLPGNATTSEPLTEMHNGVYSPENPESHELLCTVAPASAAESVPHRRSDRPKISASLYLPENVPTPASRRSAEPMNSAPRTPRIEIGTIEVEVISQPAPVKPAELSQASARTAEAVSQIGPLASNRRSNRRFAFRQR